MSTPTGPERHRTVVSSSTVVSSAVLGIAVLEASTLVAAWTRTPPHPPLGVVPFICACVAVAVVSVGLLRSAATHSAGVVTSAVFATASLLVFGPQKLFTEGMPAILPAVVVGFGLEVLVIVMAARHLMARGAATADVVEGSYR